MELRLITKVKRKALFYKRGWRLYLRDYLKKTEAVTADRIHLDAAMKWLLIAQQNSGSKGVSFAYSLKQGWLPAYPETTGYIINTFIDYYKLTNDKQYLDKAIEFGDWEFDIQMPDGSVRVRTPDSTYADVFDTGMVLLGLTQLFRETQNKKYSDAGRKAGDWLLSIQDSDGKWSKSSYKNIAHVYHSKVSWGLYELYSITTDEKYRIAAEKNLEWIFSVRHSNGWYDFMAFTKEENPYTHTIAYTLQGFWGMYKLMSDQNPVKQKLYQEIIAFSDRIIRKYELDTESPATARLPGTLTNTWDPGDQYICLTGNVQFSIVWYQVYMLNKDKKYYTAATNLLNVVKKTQILDGPERPYKYAIAGSWPIWGHYHPDEYPNWPTKFFADALLLKVKIAGL